MEEIWRERGNLGEKKLILYIFKIMESNRENEKKKKTIMFLLK